MRKHPLLAFVTAIVTCSIPGTISTARADTNTPNAAVNTAATTAAATDLKTRLYLLSVARAESAHDARARRRREAREAEKRAQALQTRRARLEAAAAKQALHGLEIRTEMAARATPHTAGVTAAKKASLAIRHYVTLGGAWASLRTCESHNDYAENTGNGYYGAYQFSLSSWSAVGRSGLPSQASPQVQDAAAEALFARQGWHAWPVCSWKIGVV